MKTKFPNTPEVRGIASLECRSLSDQDKAAGFVGVIAGSIPFNADSQVMQRRDKSGKVRPFVERIASNAFAKSLAEDRDIVATAGHADDPLSAFAIFGENLTITTTERSMDWEAKVPDTQAGRDLMTLVDMGIIKGTSFEFLPRENGETWEKRGVDMDVRTITDARLFEVNPVKWPAYLGTSLTVEMRGRYATENVGNRDYAYYGHDTTLTPGAAYANSMLEPLIAWMTNSLEYLRDQPAGDLAAFATAHVDAIAAQITALVDYLKTHGAEPHTGAEIALRSHQDFLTETRQAPASGGIHSVSHWERRMSFIKNFPVS